MHSRIADFAFDIGDILTLRAMVEMCRPEEMVPLVVVSLRADFEESAPAKYYYLRALSRQSWERIQVRFVCEEAGTGLVLLPEDELCLLPGMAREAWKLSSMELATRKEKSDEH